MPRGVLGGVSGVWVHPYGDGAVALAGHLAFQAPGWHWPLLTTPMLAWPVGRSIAMTDSNPLMSAIAKCVPGRPVNLLGLWIAVCWVLQPVAACAVYRACGRRDWAGMLAVAALALLCPAWLMRFRHINLLGHFLLLAALALAIGQVRRGLGVNFARGLVLLCVAALVHPYLFVFAAIVLSAPVWHLVLAGAAGRSRQALVWLAMCVLPVAMLVLLSGTLGAQAPGFGHYSMNLLSPVWPQKSGLFGADLPILDATGGQYEGFNYLGAGALLLVALAAVALWRRPARLDAAVVAMLMPLGALTLLALTPRIYAGHVLILPLPLGPWRRIFGAVQSSGRAFWPVGYALVIGAVACLQTRLAPRWFAGIMAIAVFLQLIDTAPMRAAAAAFYAGSGQKPPPFAMPAGAKLMRIVPACDPVNAPSDLLRLLAVRQGVPVADMRMARQPPGFTCEAALSDGLERPLLEGELRYFLPSALPRLRTDALGPGVFCSRAGAGILCSKGLAHATGASFATGAPLPLLRAGSVSGVGLAPLLGLGWRQDENGTSWSEGPRMSLLFRRAPGVGSLELSLDGISTQAGGTRTLRITVGDQQPFTLDLPDQRRTKLRLALPQAAEDAPICILFDTQRPADPAKRDLTTPVNRAAIRLFAITAAS